MLVCYISHPYTARSLEEVEANIRLAEEFGKQIALHNDYAVIVPHTNTRFWDIDSRFDDWSYPKWITYCLSIMAKCDVVAFCGEWELSRGCQEEHKMALALNKDIIYIRESIDKKT